MASRYWRYGTLYARTCDSIRLGILAKQQRPVWLEAYAAYPPLDNPIYNGDDDTITDVSFQPNALETLPIIYPEDEVRAEFTASHGNAGQVYRAF